MKTPPPSPREMPPIRMTGFGDEDAPKPKEDLLASFQKEQAARRAPLAAVCAAPAVVRCDHADCEELLCSRCCLLVHARRTNGADHDHVCRRFVRLALATDEEFAQELSEKDLLVAVGLQV